MICDNYNFGSGAIKPEVATAVDDRHQFPAQWPAQIANCKCIYSVSQIIFLVGLIILYYTCKNMEDKMHTSMHMYGINVSIPLSHQKHCLRNLLWK